ncbi:hypothetical protein U5801_09295 [Lamprobacter modestohalophilus]|jgi:hypothetical protein|uniref:hypothetical protein n=1 Tax=Chromatiaceae TaxID=1046 RepID=UPI0019137847|nr:MULTISPECIES: hypothetical protein [Chromatiaceae]MEA1050003.1 hypothetical protein [Lamprobacter modestohalophilus]
MNSSPITSWEGASAYFTFADSPAMLVLLFLLSVLVTVGVIAAMMVHEKHSFQRVKNGG